MPQASTSLIPRLAAEFFVIVIGVLVALGVDSWASSRDDRVLESDYLARLLEDARYDLAEFAFVDSIAKLGAAASQQLTQLDVIDTLSASRLVAAAFVAANTRVADPSRTTFQELINSGQIELIRSPEVRRALASYDRTINELAGAWNTFAPEWRRWLAARVPFDVFDRFMAGCAAGTPGRDIGNYQTVCAFDLGGWATGALRAQVMSEEAQRLLRLSVRNHRAHSFFALTLLSEARSLEQLLEDAVREP